MEAPKKHILLVIDKQEKTASRNKNNDDLVSQWQTLMNKKKIPYQVAVLGLPVGDIWICETEEPVAIPKDNQLTSQVIEKPKTIFNGNVVTLFDLPQQGSSLEHLMSCTSDQQQKQKKEKADNFLPTPRIIVERKTVNDLLSSMKDGRYHDQKSRLINCDAKNICILVEGYDGSKEKEDKRKRTLLSAFSHAMFRDDIPVYHTRSLTETFEFLHHSANEIALGKCERDAQYFERTKYTDNIKMSRKANLTPDKGLELQLATIPGVSTKMARAVCEQYKSMHELIEAYKTAPNEKARQNMLADLKFKGPSGKEQRLASRSEKIYCYLHNLPLTTETEKPKKKKIKTE